MLAVLAYHRAGEGKHSNTPAILEAHLAYIKKRFPTLLPGEKKRRGKLNICLTFDDASYDFYYYVYPLLKKYQLKALLAVPTHYIMERSSLSPDERLSIPYTLAMQEGIFETKTPFCTWQEIEEMVTSGHVEVAAHSHLHCNLTFDFVNLHREVIQPKEIIERRLQCKISSYVYPFGRSSPEVHSYVKQHYTYAFRLGFGYNKNWGCETKPLKRITCDQLSSPKAPFTPLQRLVYFAKSFV